MVQRTVKCLPDTGTKPSLGYNVPKAKFQQHQLRSETVRTLLLLFDCFFGFYDILTTGGRNLWNANTTVVVHVHPGKGQMSRCLKTK